MKKLVIQESWHHSRTMTEIVKRSVEAEQIHLLFKRRMHQRRDTFMMGKYEMFKVDTSE